MTVNPLMGTLKAHSKQQPGECPRWWGDCSGQLSGGICPKEKCPRGNDLYLGTPICRIASVLKEINRKFKKLPPKKRRIVTIQ